MILIFQGSGRGEEDSIYIVCSHVTHSAGDQAQVGAGLDCRSLHIHRREKIIHQSHDFGDWEDNKNKTYG